MTPVRGVGLEKGSSSNLDGVTHWASSRRAVKMTKGDIRKATKRNPQRNGKIRSAT